MSKTNDTWANELMEEEDQLVEEMRVEFRKRFERRLQKRLEEKERGLPEARNLKKKDRLTCN